MEDFINILGNQVFSMAVSIFLLVRLEQKIDEMTKAINNLNLAIEKNNFI